MIYELVFNEYGRDMLCEMMIGESYLRIIHSLMIKCIIFCSIEEKNAKERHFPLIKQRRSVRSASSYLHFSEHFDICVACIICWVLSISTWTWTTKRMHNELFINLMMFFFVVPFSFVCFPSSKCICEWIARESFKNTQFYAHMHIKCYVNSRMKYAKNMVGWSHCTAIILYRFAFYEWWTVSVTQSNLKKIHNNYSIFDAMGVFKVHFIWTCSVYGHTISTNGAKTVSHHNNLFQTQRQSNWIPRTFEKPQKFATVLS